MTARCSPLAPHTALPWAVKVFAPLSSSTNRLVWRYFETKAEAEKISKRVVYRPGNAWRAA